MPDPHFSNTPAYFKEISSGDTPSSGQVALYAKTDGKMYYKDDAGVETEVGGGGGGSITTSTTPPVSPSAGDLWFNSESGILYVYYDDGNSQQWVAPDNSGGGGKVKQFLTASKNDTQTTTLLLPTWTDITGLSITVTVGAGDTVNIFGLFQVGGNYSQNACVVRLVRSGSPDVAINSGQSAGSRSSTGTGNPFTNNSDIIFSVAHGGSDTPGAGTWTYKYQFSVSSGSTTGAAYINRSHNDPNIAYAPRAASFMNLIVT